MAGSMPDRHAYAVPLMNLSKLINGTANGIVSDVFC